MKRSISIILLAVFVLTSCSSGSGGADTTADDDANTTAPAEETTGYYDGLENLDFVGYEFTIIGYNQSGQWNMYLAPAEEDGSLVNDAA